jgi:hypothetical protein
VCVPMKKRGSEMDIKVECCLSVQWYDQRAEKDMKETSMRSEVLRNHIFVGVYLL